MAMAERGGDRMPRQHVRGEGGGGGDAADRTAAAPPQKVATRLAWPGRTRTSIKWRSVSAIVWQAGSYECECTNCFSFTTQSL